MPAAELTLDLRLVDLEAVRTVLFAAARLVKAAEWDAATRRYDGESDALPAEVADLHEALLGLGLPYSHSVDGEEAVHGWFSLSYANYLVLHRTLLQEMDGEWQARFVRCLEEFYARPWAIVPEVEFRVQAVDAATGRFVRDPIPHYRRGHVGLADDRRPAAEKEAE